MVPHLALRQQRRPPIGQRRPRRSSQLSPQPAKQEPRVTVKWCGAQNTGIPASAPTETEPAARAANVRGKQENSEPLLAVPQTRTIRPSLTSLHNYA
jgi:hypothetical protein